ncbi:MAG: flavin reductase [Rhizobiaceae bacterium]
MAAQKKAQVDGGDPAADPKAFRRALGNYPTGVTVITAPGTDAPVGVTANSFASVSLDPPLVLWSIAHTSRSHSAFVASDRFAINILADDQVKVSQAFSSSSKDKFGAVAWRRGKTGSPLIDDALAYFDCLCETRHEGGDHTIMIGRVVEFGHYEGNPLAFAQGRYGIAVDHPETGVTAQARKADDAGLAEFPLLSLIAKAHYKVDADLEGQRTAAGNTQVGSKVLAGLYNSSPLTADELARQMYLDRRQVDDSLNEFVANGDVAPCDGNRFALTASGKARRRRMIDYLAKYQEEQLADIQPADLAAARRVLESFLSNSVQTF